MPDTISLSGRFVLRMPPGMHAALRAAAGSAGLSLNEYCVRKLALPGPALDDRAQEIVMKTMAVVGAPLVGIIAFGSWARGEMSSRSDLDLLVVVEDDVEVTRDLYHKWDREAATWGPHPVELHFVHVPDAGARPSGLWAEVALDGVVLFERDLELSRRLVELRHRIVESGLVRRLAHGQPYWVEVT